ncbi:Wadjet anti-phage system protein JetD domain-containing protein [Natranaerobius thermophilus]|uniref:Wadjet protein JetD C-terminal domain-containing protein n=1 Tax=Natranaerobius thermophilus (strain ATCC BAA-1301 / DSM 18059 / JW/NM-WN-LF) TaxID=457570 RepID=B2A7R1_NATTJ|nr:Wadjet anti-phage system protein JetD domain-containing protein [Natranaerobius thermophilus]ACB84363.1 conserved hypothetical protein [Natranaerobius thermophilus JW/NM-WN-LF]
MDSNSNNNSNLSTNSNVKLTKLQKRELSKLLDKYENRKDYGKESKNPRRDFLHITEKNYPDYYHVSDSKFRLDYNAEMKELEKHGFIDLIWKKYQEGEYLEKIALQYENLEQAYSVLNRKPKIEYYRELEKIFYKYYKEASSNLNNFYEEMLSKLKHLQKLPAQVKYETPHEIEELLIGLNQLTKNKELEILKRNFSVELYRDSKRWDKYERRIVWIIKNYWSNKTDNKELDQELNQELAKPLKDHIYDIYMMEDNELLAEFGLIENPRHVNISGYMKFSTHQGEIDLVAFYPDVGLPPQMVKDMKINTLKANCIITIENLTSFYHYLSVAPDNHLVIYLGGYHNRMRRHILNKLWDFVKYQGMETKFYHWGDLDLGGFRIYNHLKEKTNIPFAPLMMDEKTYLYHIDNGHKFNKDYEKKLTDLLKDDEYSEFHNLINLMLKHKVRIEQEAVRDIVLPE